MALDVNKAVDRIDDLLQELQQAPPLTQSVHRQKLLSKIQSLTRSDDGIKKLYEYAPQLDKEGIFAETSWADPQKLVHTLVGGTLRAGHPHTTLEILSELRLLAYAMGEASSEQISAEEAQAFIEKALTNNLDLVFQQKVERERSSSEAENIQAGRRLFQFILDKLSVNDLKDNLWEEVVMITAQRPISMQRVINILQLVNNRVDLDRSQEVDQKLGYYLDAYYQPTELAQQSEDLTDYEKQLQTLDQNALQEESEALGNIMEETGLVSDYHVTLVRHLGQEEPDLLKSALALNEKGHSELKNHTKFVQKLIKRAVLPVSKQVVYGLSGTLKRNMLSRPPVYKGLANLFELTLDEQVEKDLHRSVGDDTIDAHSLLVGGSLQLLGDPLGIGQGMNPTCQAARGISLWSQHAPGKLLKYITTAAQQNRLTFRFEGQALKSDGLAEGLAPDLDYNLDPVSIILVPHLDRIYNEMMRRAGMRGEDPHKWVNPALYGHWISTGFFSAFNQMTNTIDNFDEFVRTFYWSYHPDYNGGQDLVYPSPVGLFITSSHGDLLGFHAISLLRVAEGPGGEMRAYFLNPNNEGRQNWGQGIKPTVFGNGERSGESSLPFYQFVARVYAYHYNASDLDDSVQLDEEEINEVKLLARESWGQSYTWVNEFNP